ncbi:hypothetical protein SSCG_01853 [Streptomyces clavuligerus]|nr:hypothetical protein SSCG_01853 [Streptomyces clavuligerus]
MDFAPHHLHTGRSASRSAARRRLSAAEAREDKHQRWDAVRELNIGLRPNATHGSNPSVRSCGGRRSV